MEAHNGRETTWGYAHHYTGWCCSSASCKKENLSVSVRMPGFFFKEKHKRHASCCLRKETQESRSCGRAAASSCYRRRRRHRRLRQEERWCCILPRRRRRSTGGSGRPRPSPHRCRPGRRVQVGATMAAIGRRGVSWVPLGHCSRRA